MNEGHVARDLTKSILYTEEIKPFEA